MKEQSVEELRRLAILRESRPHCGMRFRAADALEHLCDKDQGHESGHYCLVHKMEDQR